MSEVPLYYQHGYRTCTPAKAEPELDLVTCPTPKLCRKLFSVFETFRGNNIQDFKDFHLEAKAEIWP